MIPYTSLYVGNGRRNFPDGRLIVIAVDLEDTKLESTDIDNNAKLVARETMLTCTSSGHSRYKTRNSYNQITK